ncbi:MAG: hypothetical protein WDO56_14420 [Gammaproteobacteria bacterium]
MSKKLSQVARQVVAEKISSTVRVLELIGLDYRVADPQRQKSVGNRSPRVVTVLIDGRDVMRVYNGVKGATWANWVDGEPVRGIGSPEDLYVLLSKSKFLAEARRRARANT